MSPLDTRNLLFKEDVHISNGDALYLILLIEGKHRKFCSFVQKKRRPFFLSKTLGKQK